MFVGSLANSLCVAYIIVLVERRMLKREDREDAYRHYQKTTSVWIPWFKGFLFRHRLKEEADPEFLLPLLDRVKAATSERKVSTPAIVVHQISTYSRYFKSIVICMSILALCRPRMYADKKIVHAG
ncbi:hypothetical protein KSP39_PZI011491 [Platanthera zijinensis]|uniref:Uncharacterized protein n=1 Tax=Platanthera zijinensis TaxID=2320716 RepID=A0AAP0BH69_9ASPA